MLERVMKSFEFKDLQLQHRVLIAIYYWGDFPKDIPVQGRVLVTGSRTNFDLKYQRANGTVRYYKYAVGRTHITVRNHNELSTLIQNNSTVESHMSEATKEVYTSFLKYLADNAQ